MLGCFCNSSIFSQQRLAFLFLSICILIYLSSTNYAHHRLVGYAQSKTSAKTSSQSEENGPVTSQTNPIDPAETFDGLTELCQRTQWREGLWLQCHSRCGENGTSICGGLNNARNRIQTCLRLAIDAGSGLILPSVTVRDEKELVNTNVKSVCPETFWDMQHLEAVLQQQCPQLKTRQCDDLSGIDTTIHAPARTYLEAAYGKGTFRTTVDNSFRTANLDVSSVNSTNPTAISFGDSYIGWNYRQAEELSTIRKTLFKSLKFNRNLLNLSTHILDSPQLNGGYFIGVHLRGENDWPAGFGTVDDQMRLYIEEMNRIQTTLSYEIKSVYVSCGDPAAIQIFRDKLGPYGYQVHDKWTLLAAQPEMLAKVEALAFDQKAIVEYQTLVAARYQLGILTSSMSALIAYARTVENEEDFFETYIFPGSSKNGLDRVYPASPSMMGNAETKLMVVNGVDILDAFP